ncbi:PKD-like family lipoprotein [Pseudoflavitalea rhizosphaerae]|uniref:PKD-like family lipoprotein n=1 Tax=Pseudoflavitalea rhizosphaerae TaxID=1884793 RepID=UPI000F8EBDE1|nr:PKD-like family lipoprotein [Pseudoflavitalea rhizosphaerae]
MKLFYSLSIAALTMASMQGCIKDKGNYTYNDINSISIQKDIPDTYFVMVQDSLKIDLEVNQTMPAAKGITYDWVFYPSSAAPYRKHIGNSANLRALITDAPGSYVLDLFITDNNTNVSFYKKFSVNVMSAFNEGWLVLNEKDGHNDVSMILPSDTTIHNIFSKANNNQFLSAGKGSITVFQRRTAQMVYLFTPGSGLQASVSNFTIESRFNDWFFIPPATEAPLAVFTNGGEEHFLTSTRAYGVNLITPPPYKYGVATIGDYYLAPYQISSSVYGFIFYDTIAQRFWFRSGSDFSLQTVASAKPTDVWNLNNVGKRLLYAGPGTGSNFVSVFESNTKDSLFVCTGLSQGTNSYGISSDTLPAGLPLQSAGKFLASRMVPHIYFAYNNQLYIWDIPGKLQRLIYTFPSGTEVRSLKWYANPKNSSDPDNNRVIMAATKEGSEGKVYLFGVEATGDFTGGTYSKVFDGFGLIHDVTFKPQP